MTFKPQKPPAREGSEGSGPAGPRDDALFAHLFASRPPRQRRTGPWIVAGILHIPLLYFFLTSNVGHKLLERVELIVRPVLTLDDNPPRISAPIPILPPAPEPERPAQKRPEPPVASTPPIPAPALPNPGAVPTPPGGAPTGQPGAAAGAGGSAIDRMGTPLPDPRLFAPPDPE